MTSRLFVLVMTVIVAWTAGAQTPQARPGTGGRQPAPAAVPMAEHPFRIESVGLTLMLPDGARTESISVSDRPTVRVLPRGEAPTWMMNIQTPVDTHDGRAPVDLLEELMRHLGEAAGLVFKREGNRRVEEELLAVDIRVVEARKTIRVGGLEGERIYLSLPPSGASSTSIVRGYTVFKTTGRQFVSFELVTTQAAFAAAKRVYETIVATAAFEDADELRTARAAVIAAGLRLFEQVDETDLRAIINGHAETWERIYRPAPTGSDTDAEELGYVRTQMKIGTLDDLGNRTPSRNIGNRRQGYIVRIDGRYLDQGQVIDTNSAFFMSMDRTYEAWTVRLGLRRWSPGQTWPVKEKPGEASEIGARDGASMFVELAMPGQPKQTVKPIIQGDGYISRVEAYLLPYIIVREGIEADFGFYSYDSRQNTIRLRHDTLARPSNAGGPWTVRTRLSEEDKPQVAFYSPAGDLIRIELPEGRLREPTSVQRLMQLWKSKNLPTE